MCNDDDYRRDHKFGGGAEMKDLVKKEEWK